MAGTIPKRSTVRKRAQKRVLRLKGKRIKPWLARQLNL